MALVRWSPFTTRWPDLFDEEDFTSLVTTASNNLDLVETNDEVIVKANVAGVKPEEIDITVEKGTLWIQAQREESEEKQEGKYHSRSSWRYSYRVTLPEDVDTEADPAAETDNGVLTVRFNKSERSKPRKLTVKARKSN